MTFILDIHVKGKEAENLAQIYLLKKIVDHYVNKTKNKIQELPR